MKWEESRGEFRILRLGFYFFSKMASIVTLKHGSHFRRGPMMPNVSYCLEHIFWVANGTNDIRIDTVRVQPMGICLPRIDPRDWLNGVWRT